MKIIKSDLNMFQNLINVINSISDTNNSDCDIDTIYDYIDKDDLIEFLSMLGAVKKSNINNIRKFASKEMKSKISNKGLKVESAHYTSAEILKIFDEYTDIEIIKNFKTDELKAMYYSIYDQIPSKSKNKQYIVSDIRNYIYSSKRADAFN